MKVKGIVKIISLAAFAAATIYIATLFLKPEIEVGEGESERVVVNQSPLKSTKALQQEKPSVTKSVTENISSNSVKTVSKAEDDTEKSVEIVPPTAEEQKVIDEIDRLLGDDEEKKAVQAARRIMKSSNPDVRREAVDTFGWVGIQAINELSEMLLDPDPDVAGDAFESWDSSVDDISDEATRANVLSDGIKKLTDQDNIEDALMSFDSMESYIAVPAIADIIETGTPDASILAREHYEFTTGEPYQSADVTAVWVAKERAEQSPE